jgi:anti-sigma factor RsiW
MNCEQAEERLSPYLDGMLTQDERREIAIHLQSCSRCMALLAEFRQNDILLARLPRVSPAASLHERIFSTPEMIELAKNASSRSFFSMSQPAPYLPSGKARPKELIVCGPFHQAAVILRGKQR